MNPIIGILTDFSNDFAIASIKGVLLSDIPHAILIDIDHTIEKFSILSGAFVISQTYSFFPKSSYFLCIIDPGVGSSRREIYVKRNGYHFIGPDNGLLTPLFVDGTAETFIINGANFTPSSHTFHGRDLFAPALAAIAKGKKDFLTPIHYKELIEVNIWEKPRIAYIDSFGNIKTTQTVSNEQARKIKSALIECNNKTYDILFVKTFNDAPQHTLVCYKGSNNTLEIAVNQGNAQKYLNTGVGASLAINFELIKD